jgi:hypothetical protein
MEVVRKSTSDEWKSYGEILRRIDEAKQWIIYPPEYFPVAFPFVGC